MSNQMHFFGKIKFDSIQVCIENCQNIVTSGRKRSSRNPKFVCFPMEGLFGVVRLNVMTMHIIFNSLLSGKYSNRESDIGLLQVCAVNTTKRIQNLLGTPVGLKIDKVVHTIRQNKSSRIVISDQSKTQININLKDLI